MSEKKYDVVIYCIATRAVDSIVGRGLEYDRGGGYGQCASKRLATVLPRLNDLYDAAIVPAGKYDEGDKITKRDLQGNDWSESRSVMREASQ